LEKLLENIIQKEQDLKKEHFCILDFGFVVLDRPLVEGSTKSVELNVSSDFSTDKLVALVVEGFLRGNVIFEDAE